MPKQRDRFQEVLTEAIDDMMEHGFDSVERVQHWTRRLAEAAGESARMSEQDLAKMLREELARTYKRMVEDGGLVKFHPGVQRFTIDKLKPAMRSELDRRIMASADLIKLNREQAIAKTLQRFQGWSTSIPQNGVSGEKKAAVKATVRKSLTQLPFEERRVLIDQGHKLVAAISEIVASDGGAIAGRWRSHWRQAGYDYREDHKERDEQVYLVRDSWAHQRGLVKKGGNPFYDEITAVGQEPFCFPGDSKIRAAGVEAAYRRFYDGVICTVFFAFGPPLQATPNHPVMTDRGWLPVGELDGSDHVFRVDDDAVGLREKNQNDLIPSISQVFAACAKGGVSEVRSGKFEQFHGDGSIGDVDVVRSARLLRFGVPEACSLHRVEKLILTVTALGRSAVRSLNLLLHRGLGAAAGIVSSGGQALTTGLAFAGHPHAVGGASAPDLAAGLPDDVAHDLSRDLEPGSESEDACAVLMRAANRCRVVRVERSNFSGHVYNLQTQSGWYVVNGIIAHNCRCYMVWLYNLRDLPKEMLTKKGDDALGEARAKVRGFADSEKAPKEQVDYVTAWADAETRCARCSMFVQMSAGEVGNKCTAVVGTIDASAHCRLFKPARAKTDVAPKVGAAADVLRIERVRALIVAATSKAGLDLSR